MHFICSLLRFLFLQEKFAIGSISIALGTSNVINGVWHSTMPKRMASKTLTVEPAQPRTLSRQSCNLKEEMEMLLWQSNLALRWTLAFLIDLELRRL